MDDRPLNAEFREARLCISRMFKCEGKIVLLRDNSSYDPTQYNP